MENIPLTLKNIGIESIMIRELNTYSEFPCITREYVISGHWTKVHCPDVEFNSDVFNRLVKYITAYRDDNTVKLGHYIVVVDKELDKKFLSDIYVIADPHGYCLAPWMDTGSYLNKVTDSDMIDPSLLPSLIKSELVNQFGHLI